MYHQHQYCSKVRVKDLNEHLMCVLCGGYFIDATTIIECLHSFCRSCIVRYLESSKYCPICDVQVHKTRPLLNIRSDKTLQDLVYKLIPDLFDEEMRRRREFLKAHPEVKTNRMDLEQRGQALLVPVHCMPDHRISLVLHMATPDGGVYTETKRSTARSKKAGDRRYLLCPSDVTMGILKKFIRSKFSLSDKFQIDLFYTQREEVISDEFTLLDVTFIYSWTREKPLRLFYTIYEKPRRKRRLLTDRLRQLQSSQAKRRRLEQAGHNGSPAYTLPHVPSDKSSSTPDRQRPKKPGVGRPVSKSGSIRGAQSSYQGATQKVKMKKKDFWNLHKRETLKMKRKSLENAQKVGRGRKQKMQTTPSPEKSDDVKPECRRPGESKSKTNAKPSAGHLTNGRPVSRTAPDSPDPDKNGVHDSLGHGDRASSPGGQGKESRGGAVCVATTVNGVHRAAKRTSLDSRSASPRLSTPGSSRSSSPRLPTVATSRTGRAASPRSSVMAKAKVCGARDYVSGGKEEGRVGREGSRPGSRASSQADSPRLMDLQHVLPTADRFPSLPVDEKISVDVSMAASASETSSDVTSPGAEDRSHSAGLEEPGDFHGNVCNVATFAPRALPSLVHVHNINTHRQSADKGSGGVKQGVDSGTGGGRQNGNKSGESQSNKEKSNSQKQSVDRGNGVKQSVNKTKEGHRDSVSKVNGHRQERDKDHGSDNKSHGGHKQGLNKGGLNKEQMKTPRASQLQTKPTGRTANRKR
ncbi:uncharacterized protein LOC143301460 [Babylonia areolata]|uniref:uncharacterized protein LOC143301460 n=1 Tax=Babylonia areolata TaxID=304850 RepID=UPI003FD3FBD6